MALREFTDGNGVAWQVWEVHSTMAERRRVTMRRAAARETAERRLIDRPSMKYGQSFDHGWLSFRSSVERRRRSVIPPHWDELSTDGLRALLADSRATGPVRRLVD